MIKSVKLSKEEVAKRIELDGKLDPISSSARVAIYDAFGQRWRIEYNWSGSVIRIEQINKQGEVIHL